MNIFIASFQHKRNNTTFLFSFEIRTNDYDASDMACAYLKQTLGIEKTELFNTRYKKTGYDLDHVDKGINYFSVENEDTYNYIEPIIEAVELLSGQEILDWIQAGN
jgi:hypothetical protein